MHRILVIDDNDVIREALCELFEQAGYQTVDVASGKVAVQIHQTEPVDLIITDIFMPDIDGLEIIQQFRSEFPEVKIIAVSGGGSRGLVELLTVASKMGADRVFMKPVEFEEILAAVQELLA